MKQHKACIETDKFGVITSVTNSSGETIGMPYYTKSGHRVSLRYDNVHKIGKRDMAVVLRDGASGYITMYEHTGKDLTDCIRALMYKTEMFPGTASHSLLMEARRVLRKCL